MKKIPDEIYIQAVVAPDWDIEECNWFERTWSTKRIHEDDIVFIKKPPNQENTTDAYKSNDITINNEDLCNTGLGYPTNRYR